MTSSSAMSCSTPVLLAAVQHRVGEEGNRRLREGKKGGKKGGKKKTSEAHMKNYQSQVSILGPVGYGPTTLPLRHSDVSEDCLL